MRLPGERNDVAASLLWCGWAETRQSSGCLAWAACKLRPFWSAAALPIPGAIVRLSRPLLEICHGRGKGGGNFDVWTSSERVTLQALGLDNGPA
jgi:hypothetical protein